MKKHYLKLNYDFGLYFVIKIILNLQYLIYKK